MSAARQPDYVEVGRKAHELVRSHGPVAHFYAARLASEALIDGEFDAHALWKAVELSLTPR